MVLRLIQCIQILCRRTLSRVLFQERRFWPPRAPQGRLFPQRQGGDRRRSVYSYASKLMRSSRLPAGLWRRYCCRLSYQHAASPHPTPSVLQQGNGQAERLSIGPAGRTSTDKYCMLSPRFLHYCYSQTCRWHRLDRGYFLLCWAGKQQSPSWRRAG